jgi:hypothetical protein
MNMRPRQRPLGRIALLISIAVAVSLSAGRPSAAQSATPRLVVILAVDQMRSDYIEQYGARWTQGLRRLIDRGARSPMPPARAEYRHVRRARRRDGTFRGSTDDFELLVRALARRAAAEDRPPRQLRQADRRPQQSESLASRSPTRCARRARSRQRSSRCRSRRAAITLAGQRSDATVWFNDKAQAFVTSATLAARAILEQFFKTHPVSADYGKVWMRKLDADGYRYADAAAGELPPNGWTSAFPHPLIGRTGSVDAQFFEHWKASPFADAYLGAIARAAVTALAMGKGEGTDYLAISFSTLDNVGHKFGPRSHEVQDVLLRLDDTIGELLRSSTPPSAKGATWSRCRPTMASRRFRNRRRRRA